MSLVQQVDAMVQQASSSAPCIACLRNTASSSSSMNYSKPRLRGVLHSYATTAILSAGLILIIEAPDTRSTLAASIYVVAAFLQFAISAIYHTGNWGPGTTKLLMRLDHSAIYSLIAATHTPFLVVPLGHLEVAGSLLMRMWMTALCGVGKTWLWPHAPKQINAVLYVLMGWSAVPFLPIFIEHVGLKVALLVALGGVLYSIGAFVYAARWPDPFPNWFGYHEVFHALVILASIAHFTSMYLVLVKRSFAGAVLHG